MNVRESMSKDVSLVMENSKHSQLSYCYENLDARDADKLLRKYNLKGFIVLNKERKPIGVYRSKQN